MKEEKLNYILELLILFFALLLGEYDAAKFIFTGNIYNAVWTVILSYIAVRSIISIINYKIKNK